MRRPSPSNSLLAFAVIAGAAAYADTSAIQEQGLMVAASLSHSLGLRGRLPAMPDSYHFITPRLNGTADDEAILVLERDGAVWLPLAYLQRVGIKVQGSAHSIRGRQYVPASNLTPATVRLASDLAQLDITCGSGCFEERFLSAKPHKARTYSAITPGLFMNYDIFSQFGDVGDVTAGFAETGLFTPSGTGLTNLFCASSNKHSCTRLESSWTIDNPDASTRLLIGDAVSAADTWGAPVRFGGLRWGTDFTLNPDYLPFPTPSISGDATVPGTVDILINASERFRGDIQPGPFTITDLPVVTGAGTAQAVVRDVLGRETIVSTRFYTAPQLLRSGLSSYSIEAGWLRDDFGIRSNSYRDPFIAAGYAKGLSETLTLGLRTELSDDLASAGMSAARSHADFGVFQGSAAMSDSTGHTGSRFELRHEYRSRAFTIGSDIAFATEDFRRIGETGPLPRTTARAFLGWDVDSIGTASLNWVAQDERLGDDYSAVGLGFTSRWQDASISLSALQITQPDDAFVASLMVSVPLGMARTVSSSLDYRGSDLAAALRMRKSAPPSGGLGYNAEAEVDGTERYRSGLLYRGSKGEIAAELSKVDQQSAGRVSLRGGLAYLADEVILAPTITESLAVVTIDDEPGVRVYHDRQLAGVTDRRGKLVIPNVRDYEQNVLSFEPTDLRLDANFSKAELTLTPGHRTGHVVNFEVTHHTDILVNIEDAGGQPLAAGTRVTDVQTGAAYPVGTLGRVFIPNAPPQLRLVFTTNGSACAAQIDNPKVQNAAPVADLGTFTCMPKNAGDPT